MQSLLWSNESCISLTWRLCQVVLTILIHNQRKNQKNSSECSDIHLYIRALPGSPEKVKIVGKDIVLVPPNISKKVDAQNA